MKGKYIKEKQHKRLTKHENEPKQIEAQQTNHPDVCSQMKGTFPQGNDGWTKLSIGHKKNGQKGK